MRGRGRGRGGYGEFGEEEVFEGVVICFCVWFG